MFKFDADGVDCQRHPPFLPTTTEEVFSDSRVSASSVVALARQRGCLGSHLISPVSTPSAQSGYVHLNPVVEALAQGRHVFGDSTSDFSIQNAVVGRQPESRLRLPRHGTQPDPVPRDRNTSSLHHRASRRVSSSGETARSIPPCSHVFHQRARANPLDRQARPRHRPERHPDPQRGDKGAGRKDRPDHAPEPAQGFPDPESSRRARDHRCGFWVAGGGDCRSHADLWPLNPMAT